MRKSALHFVLLFLLLLGLAWWNQAPPLTFYNSDVGLRFWQARELAAQEWGTFAIRYPAAAVDPNLEFLPLYCAYSLVDGQLFFNITPFVPYVTSYLYTWLGTFGLILLPVLGGVLTAFGVYKLARLAQIRYAVWAFWAAMAATPLFFYSLLLWDHSVAVACAVWAVYSIVWGVAKQRRSGFLLSGLVLAVGLGQRPEMYLFAGALGLGFLVIGWPYWRNWLVWGGSVLAVILLTWWVQWRWFGHPLGMVMAPQLFDYGRPESYVFLCQRPVSAIRLSRFLLYIGSYDFQSLAAALFVIFGFFLLIFIFRLPRLQRPVWLGVALGFIFLGYTLWGPLLWRSALPGLITTFPLLGFSLLYVEKPKDRMETRPIYRLTLITAFSFLTGMLLLWPAYGGDHWGARYLLPVYPLLVFLAFYAFEIWLEDERLRRAVYVAGAALLAASVIIQLAGVRHIVVKRQENVALYKAIDALPADVIVTNHPFLPTTLISLWEDKTFLYVDSEEDIAAVIGRLKENGISRFAFISLYDLPLSVPERVDGVTVRQVTPVVYELE
ncbi:MAG: hypothetical protein HF973_00990 [Chloroflexi bacterium]|nr:hypothetical protein [Chloroflexota bacterium]